MFTFNFGRKVRRVARRQWRREKLDFVTYRKIVVGSRDPDTVAKWKLEVEKKVPGAPWAVKTGTDFRDKFSEIWDWFIENWPTILKLLLTLMVFVEPEPQSEGEESD